MARRRWPIGVEPTILCTAAVRQSPRATRCPIIPLGSHPGVHRRKLDAVHSVAHLPRDGPMINTLYLPELREMLAENNAVELQEFTTALHPARTAEFMAGLSADEAWAVLQHAAPELRCEIFSYFDEAKQVEIIESQDRQDIGQMPFHIGTLASDPCRGKRADRGPVPRSGTAVGAWNRIYTSLCPKNRPFRRHNAQALGNSSPNWGP